MHTSTNVLSLAPRMANAPVSSLYKARRLQADDIAFTESTYGAYEARSIGQWNGSDSNVWTSKVCLVDPASETKLDAVLTIEFNALNASVKQVAVTLANGESVNNITYQ